MKVKEKELRYMKEKVNLQIVDYIIPKHLNKEEKKPTIDQQKDKEKLRKEENKIKKTDNLH